MGNEDKQTKNTRDRSRDILLCDLDAFFASVEQLDRPELKAQPVIVGGDRSRGVVSTCSYEARKYGVRSAMPLQRALELCPDAVLLPVNMKRYREYSEGVREILERFTPEIEPVSIDEAYLALEKGAGLKEGKNIRSMVGEELGLPLSIGVSANKMLAKIACEEAKPDNIKAIWPEEVPEVLWPMSVRSLPGVGPATEKKLNNYGIKTVGDVAEWSRVSLSQLLGQNGPHLQDFARGIDRRKIETEEEIKSISEETTFPEDIFDNQIMQASLYELTAGVGYRLRRHGFFAKTVSIKLRFPDFRTITRDTTLSAATDRDAEIYRVAKELLERHGGLPPWRLLGVRLSGLVREKQLSLFSRDPRWEKEKHLTRLKDGLRNRYGCEVVYDGKRLFKKDNKK